MGLVPYWNRFTDVTAVSNKLYGLEPKLPLQEQKALLFVQEGDEFSVILPAPVMDPFGLKRVPLSPRADLQWFRGCDDEEIAVVQ